MHYPNIKNNVSKILNRRNDGYNTIICNAPCQSGKTDIVPCLQTEFKDGGNFIPIVSDNHLYDENERAIREQNIQVRCEKLKDKLDILENGGEISYSPFIAFDEGRLIRIKITYPDDRVDLEINNNVFCEQ
jgi:hypothetical protein